MGRVEGVVPDGEGQGAGEVAGSGGFLEVSCRSFLVGLGEGAEAFVHEGGDSLLGDRGGDAEAAGGLGFVGGGGGDRGAGGAGGGGGGGEERDLPGRPPPGGGGGVGGEGGGGGGPRGAPGGGADTPGGAPAGG